MTSWTKSSPWGDYLKENNKDCKGNRRHKSIIDQARRCNPNLGKHVGSKSEYTLKKSIT